MPEVIRPDDLVPMDLFVPHEPLQIDLVYAQENHPQNIFKTALYHGDARLFLHRDLARIVVAVSRRLHKQHQWILVLKDGLRTREAEQAAMATDIIKNNPHWLEGPDVLFSKPGTGAHPRGMAVDVSVIHQDGTSLDMGTVFDEMSEQSARDYKDFTSSILQNRQYLEDAFTQEAARLQLPMLPLPAEWWDFRFPRAYYERWAPLSDADLPEDFHMHAAWKKQNGAWQARFDKAAKEVLNSL